MKKCCSCKNSKDDDDFSWKNRAKGTRANICKPCYNIIRRRRYNKNKVNEVARIKRRKNSLQDYVRSLRKQCVRCEQKHPATLQFHHLDPSSKEIQPSRMALHGWSLKRIDKELAKCIVLCANCHAIEHYKLEVR